MQEHRSGLSVSVAMATYNGARFLREQLESIAAQSRLPAELVVSDDGSTDDTLAIVADFARTAPFPITILPPHARLGFADNFLHAAHACHGDLIGFADQDDYWLHDKLDRTAARIEADDSLIAIHPLAVTDGALQPTGLIWSQDIDADRVIEPLDLDPYLTGFGNSMLVRRAVLTAIPHDRRPPQPDQPHLSLAHDHWIYTLAAALGRVSYVAAPLLRYRQHGSNTYGVRPRSLRNRLYSAVTIPEKRFRQEALFDRQIADLFAEMAAVDTPFANRAAHAATTYRQRAFLCEQRLLTYDAPHLAARFVAFRDSRSVPFYRPWIGSSIKEALFGVAGLGRWVGRETDR